ncbi:protein-tyrosine phosphatase family protein [Pseudonocardia sp. CA-107938]|uniref:protein-tyrosine phosphatase family protein n=1 Tax=Pseudonocardia sp. CA-107938 TaxID=3240021 RepID=UPI003D8D3BFC
MNDENEPGPVGEVVFGDGTVVRGRGRRQPLPPGPAPQFGLYLGSPPDRAGRAWLRRRPFRTDWPAEWIDWPDFRTPRRPAEAAEQIERAFELARSGTRVEVACGGGNGRTGTVLACMATLAGEPPETAVAWVRANYRRHAVETRAQRRWIEWFAARDR